MLWDLWSQSSNIVELWRMLVASRKEESFACRRLECFKEGRATWICREFRANYIHIYVSQWVPREQHELLKSYIERGLSPSLKRGHRFSKMIFLAPFRLLPPTVGGGSGWRIGWLGLFRLLILRRGQRWTQKCQVLHSHEHNFDLFRFAAAKQDDKITLCRAKMSLWQLIRKKGIRAQQNVNTD